MNLLEHYAGRLKAADNMYVENTGKHMDANRKIALAVCLRNTSNFLNEAFTSAAGTQRSDLGAYKKFSMNLVNVVMP